MVRYLHHFTISWCKSLKVLSCFQVTRSLKAWLLQFSTVSDLRLIPLGPAALLCPRGSRMENREFYF